MEATEVGKKKSQVGDGLAGEEWGGRLTAGPSEVRCRGGSIYGSTSRDIILQTDYMD